MIKRKVSSQGYELDWNVPQTEQEYDSLAPKRTKPCLEDAILSTWYRGGANKFRDALCTHIEKVTGVARINSGTEEKPEWEKEGVYLKRAFAEYAKARGMDPAAKATRDTIIAETSAEAQKILDGIPFDPSERESTGTGPSLAKTYIEWAKLAYKKDGGTRMADLLGKALNTTITLPAAGTSGDADKDAEPVITALAKAISANEKRKRDIETAKAKSEYEIDGAETA
jgi:hypothetical protein